MDNSALFRTYPFPFTVEEFPFCTESPFSVASGAGTFFLPNLIS